MKFVRPVSVIHTAHNLKGGLQLADLPVVFVINLKVRLNPEVTLSFF